MDDRKLFTKILVANRGEIAIRVIRACKELGIPTVAVYSEADRAALHVRMADEAYCIGAPPSRQSYGSADRILEVAKKAGCDAIHPGYGFLSEQADFAERCAEERITIIGSNPSAIRVASNKISSRRAADKVGVPVVPGMMESLRNESHATEWAEKIGYPLMFKAATGTGGNAIHKVHRPECLHASFRAAKTEARNCFGDGTLYLERYVENPRHVEIQVLADKHGSVVHCMEREYSIQRRYQTLIAEAPSSFLDDELRGKMSEAAIRIARAINLDSAGTVEFIVSGRTGEFFFLEMHTGLPVEHAVTEAITGIDLCKEMITIAAGHPLTFRQEEIGMHGHAIECRISAEDPDNNFLPSPGKIVELRLPGGLGVRNESCMYPGLEIPVFYDPLLSKLVVWDTTRERCIARTRRALAEYVVKGIQTTIPFLEQVIQSKHFIAGDFDATFVNTERADVEEQKPYADVALIAAVLKAFRRDEHASRESEEGSNGLGEVVSAWKMSGRVTR